MSGEGRARQEKQVETIGKRVARLRNVLGWTQQSLAARLALSRVAVSHIEMDLTTPSERTIILLAGTFKLSPFELVEGTTYPQAKAERLPEITCCYTPLEADWLVLKNDLAWLEKLGGGRERTRMIEQVHEEWGKRLKAYQEADLDDHENKLLAEIRQTLGELKKRYAAPSG